MLEFAQYYYFIYWFIAMLITVNQFNLMRKYPANGVLYQKTDYTPIVLFLIFYILFFGLRPISGRYFCDTQNYANRYELMQNYDVFSSDGTNEATKDVLFYNFMYISAHVMDVHLFFLICMFLYIVPMYLGCKKLDARHSGIFMLFCIGSFEFYAYSVNGVRNGISCSMAILALAFLCKGEKLWAATFSLVAMGIHKSAALPIFAMLFTYFVRKPKYMFITWLGAIVTSLAIGGYIDNLLSLISYDERLANNLQNDDSDGVIMEHSFRWDFLLYSSMPILLGWYTVFKRKLYDKPFLLLLGTYIYANAFWVLAIRAIFSNRIAYLSWFLYPIVLAYPLLNFPVFKKNHSQKTAWILLGHFGFTTVLWLLGK